jgi:hypothetical protein
MVGDGAVAVVHETRRGPGGALLEITVIAVRIVVVSLFSGG